MKHLKVATYLATHVATDAASKGCTIATPTFDIFDIQKR